MIFVIGFSSMFTEICVYHVTFAYLQDIYRDKVVLQRKKECTEQITTYFQVHEKLTESNLGIEQGTKCIEHSSI